MIDRPEFGEVEEWYLSYEFLGLTEPEWRLKVGHQRLPKCWSLEEFEEVEE